MRYEKKHESIFALRYEGIVQPNGHIDDICGDHNEIILFENFLQKLHEKTHEVLTIQKIIREYEGEANQIAIDNRIHKGATLQEVHARAALDVIEHMRYVENIKELSNLINSNPAIYTLDAIIEHVKIIHTPMQGETYEYPVD